jgi:hypothetical protein
LELANAEIEEHQGQFAVSSVVSKPPNSSPFAVQPLTLGYPLGTPHHFNIDIFLIG